jgi:hypothetical protein
MNTDERTKIMDAIAAAGDAEVLRFAGMVLSMLETRGEVTAEDAQDFAERKGLL